MEPIDKAAARALAGIAVLALLTACGPAPDRGTPQGQTAATPAAPLLPPLPVYSTLAAAVEGFMPSMTDEQNGFSEGARKLAAWGASRMEWQQLRALPMTRRAKVMKDPSAERGRLICLSGQIIEIEVAHFPAGDVTIGGMADYEGNIYRFANVRSSGELVERSPAAMCGVVIGKIDYSNSMGGVEHAVQLVGMFDLPENRPAKL